MFRYIKKRQKRIKRIRNTKRNKFEKRIKVFDIVFKGINVIVIGAIGVYIGHNSNVISKNNNEILNIFKQQELNYKEVEDKRVEEDRNKAENAATLERIPRIVTQAYQQREKPLTPSYYYYFDKNLYAYNYYYKNINYTNMYLDIKVPNKKNVNYLFLKFQNVGVLKEEEIQSSISSMNIEILNIDETKEHLGTEFSIRINLAIPDELFENKKFEAKYNLLKIIYFNDEGELFSQENLLKFYHYEDEENEIFNRFYLKKGTTFKYDYNTLEWNIVNITSIDPLEEEKKTLHSKFLVEKKELLKNIDVSSIQNETDRKYIAEYIEKANSWFENYYIDPKESDFNEIAKLMSMIEYYLSKN